MKTINENLLAVNEGQHPTASPIMVPSYTAEQTCITRYFRREQSSALIEYIKRDIVSILSNSGWHYVAIFKTYGADDNVMLFLHDKSAWTLDELDGIFNVEHSSVTPIFFDSLIPIERDGTTQLFPESANPATDPYHEICLELRRMFGISQERKRAFAYMTGKLFDSEIADPGSDIISRMVKEYKRLNVSTDCRKAYCAAIVYNTIYDMMYDRIRKHLEEEGTFCDERDVSKIAAAVMDEFAWTFSGSEELAIKALDVDLDSLIGIF